MTNRQKFERAKMIEAAAELTPKQSAAIESLTEQEVESLISAKTKLSAAWQSGTRGIIGPIKAREDDEEYKRGGSKGQTKAKK